MNGTGRVVQLDADAHNAVQALLPWYATRRLPRDELARVEAHLAHCPRCQAELEWERKLQAAHNKISERGELGSTDLLPDVERGLAALRQQIEATPRLRGRRRAWLRGLGDRFERWREGRRDRWHRWHDRWHDSAAWLRWVLGAQFVVMALLAAALLLPIAPTETYRALGTPASAKAGNAVVMFAPGASEQQVRSALQHSGARLVDGPTASGAYVVHVQSAAVLARLRAQPGVALAESLDAGAAP